MRTDSFFMTTFTLCPVFLITLLFAPSTILASPPEDRILVPDRPGYALSTWSVLPSHWQIELGTSWAPDFDFGGAALVRYGLASGWELRLGTPTLTQATAEKTSLSSNPTSPPLAVGGTTIGTKWSGAWGINTFSSALMVGIPTSGASQSISPDPLVSLQAQLSRPLNQKVSTGVSIKYALMDHTRPAIDSAYGEEIGQLFGVVGSIKWSEVDWLIFSQAGVELLDDLVTPIVGAGGALRISRHLQLDLSVNTQIKRDGLRERYLAGITAGW